MKSLMPFVYYKLISLTIYEISLNRDVLVKVT